MQDLHFDGGTHLRSPDATAGTTSHDFDDLISSLSTGLNTPCGSDDKLNSGSESLKLSESLFPGYAVDPGTAAPPLPKIGARFNRDVVRTLKSWLAIHRHHPYPDEEDMSSLMKHTGLSRAQVSNWFANARRRGYMHRIRPASPQVPNASSSPIDIVTRPGTPAPRRDIGLMNPLERWVDSPPEHEPAAAGDIARAVASSSSMSMQQKIPYVSVDASSATSAGTSHSSEVSNYLSSDASQNSLRVGRKLRKKKNTKVRRVQKALLRPDEMLPFQCTFCTETFRTKYDWHRHEKSLHLPLDQWVCSPHGPCATKGECISNEPHECGSDCTPLCCVFCGEVRPDLSHIESHCFSECQSREPGERNFHRKDHLVQHLRLFHNAKFLDWTMKTWKVPAPEVRSRCGFCSLEMITWTDRRDHLAEHFKMGKTMADWKGDWGFDPVILELVENAIPPYLNVFERTTPFPTKASDLIPAPSEAPINAYDLLKLEVVAYIQIHLDTTGKLPLDQDIQLEACRIIFAAEETWDQGISGRRKLNISWLRDLIMSSSEITNQARYRPGRLRGESRILWLGVSGRRDLFEQCPLESQLQAFVQTGNRKFGSVEDGELQNKACEMIRSAEQESTSPSATFANWLVNLIYSGTDWLSSFKMRTGIFPGIAPSNLIPLSPGDGTRLADDPIASSHQASPFSAPQANDGYFRGLNSTFPRLVDHPESTFASSFTVSDFCARDLSDELPGDTVFNRYFVGDLARWVASTISPNNPNTHIPTDEEIQHQARWIMYGGDDPWNQTPADVPEWLWRFKRDIGMLKETYASYAIGDFVRT